MRQPFGLFKATHLLSKLNREGVTYKMAAVTFTTPKIIGILAAVAVLFALGFVIGWVSAPSDEDGSVEVRNPDMKYVANKRKEDMKTKTDFHEELFDILNAKKIGDNLR